jgi:hypothetical protein
MKWTFLTLSAVFFITLLLFLQDAEIQAGVERLAEMKLSHSPTFDADPNLKLVSERSPYMRDER